MKDDNLSDDKSSLQASVFRRVRSFFGEGGGGGVNFKLERTSCQQSLKYISLYNTEGAPFYIEYYPLEIASPAEAVQS